MNIIVCIKQVPDTTEVRLDPKTNTLIRDGVPSIINPDDKAGIEAALQIKEKTGAAVTVVSMGPPQAEKAIREALAMGCDKGVLVSGREFGGADTLATSTTIAQAVKKLDYDLIIAGRQAIDGDTAQVGPQIAEHLGLPQISYAESVEVEENKVVVKRQFEDRYHVLEAEMPVLITTLGESFTPRYMTVGGCFDAYREKEVAVWGYQDLIADLSEEEAAEFTRNIGLKGSPTRVKKSFVKEAKGAGTILKDITADEAVDAIIGKLQEKHLI
ncbi:MAG: electron transfer flavoprotein subunit beta/FixA family protein [Eubacteriales bacterium]|nr:electron transfer flavoprotein subunit beta/FixA family protein [Eubacteriales bacterium]